jgi:hypothetical protein
VRGADVERQRAREGRAPALVDARGAASTSPCDILDVDLNHPSAIAFDGDEAIISAAFNSQVLRVDLASGTVNEVYGRGARAYEGDGGPATDAAFDVPSSVVVAPAGDLLVLDQANQVIRRLEQDGTVDRVAGGCFTDDDYGSCTAADGPAACEESDKLTCGTSNFACQSVCLPDFAGDGGPARDARFAFDFGANLFPVRMAGAPSGDLFVADPNNHRIRRVDGDGVITTAAGNGEPGFGPGQLDHPTDVAIGPDGTLYVADPYASCIRALAPGGELATVAGRCGERGSGGDGGPATEALLDQPMGVEVASGFLYIADTANDVVRAVRLE